MLGELNPKGPKGPRTPPKGTRNQVLRALRKLVLFQFPDEAYGYSPRERIFIELMTADRKLKASREGSK